MAIKILLMLTVILAPNFSRERRIVPTVAVARAVLAIAVLTKGLHQNVSHRRQPES